MSQDYIDKIGILPSECDCEICKSMCHGPCNGSVEDFEKLIDAGFAKKLMLDDLPNNPPLPPTLRPALKGYGGKRSPWETWTEKGCIFWDSKGHCKLHKSGLKPTEGKIGIHGNFYEYVNKFTEITKTDWGTEKGKLLIEKWKKLVDFEED